jgi:hypothetical protein
MRNGIHYKKGPSIGRNVNVAPTTLPGLLIGGAGAFLASEGILSMLFSQDQQTISTAGRVARIGIGLSMMGLVIAKS